MAVAAAVALGAGLGREAALVAVAGALAPDVDEPGSKAGRVVAGAGPLLALGGWWVHRPEWVAVGIALALLPFVLRHRTWSHSLWFLGAVWAAMRVVAPPAAVPLALGVASHLVLDALTPMGIRPLYPAAWTLRLGSIRTGGWMDRLIGFGAALLALVILLG